MPRRWVAGLLTLVVSVLALTSCGGSGSEPKVTTEPGGVRLQLDVKDGAPVGGIKRVAVERGDAVLIRVKSDVSDEIHVHGYDLSAPVEAGASATIEFTADIAGRFEVELESRGVQIAELTVQ